MDIALAFDSNYAPHVPAAVESLLDKHGPGELCFWMVATDDVAEDARLRLVRQVGGRAGLAFLDPGRGVDDLPVSTVAQFSYLSRAAHLRVLVPHLLPSHVKRVLYLDSDILCVGPLRELSDLDLLGNTVAAVRDANARRLCDMGGMPGLADYGELRPQAPYFNSGVLLIDVPAWHNDDITAKCLDYARRHAAEARFPDQDALNYALHGRWLRLDKRWNHMLGARLESSVGGSLSEARLVHQIGPDKLWLGSTPPGDRKALYEAYARKARAAAGAGEERR